MSVLSDAQILDAIKNKQVSFHPELDLDRQVQPASIDLRLGSDFRTFKQGRTSLISPRQGFNISEITELTHADNFFSFILHPGEFVLATTMESVHLPSPPAEIRKERRVNDHPERLGSKARREWINVRYPSLVGRVEGRSSWGRLGVVVHATAGFIDPGFEGTITLEVSHVGKIPVELCVGDYICQLTLMETGWVQRPYGHPSRRSKYQGQSGPTGSRIGEEHPNESRN